MHRSLAAALLACAVVSHAGFSVPTAHAAEGPAVTSKRTVATLISDVDGVSPGHLLHLALRLRLAAGWHTYWINPGDAGEPASLDLALPTGSVAGPITWPTPSRVAEGTLTTYAYTGDVVLPFTLTPGQAPLSVQAHASWLACREICVPEQADLTLDLPAGDSASSPQSALITAALAKAPQPAPFTAAISTSGELTLSGPGLPGNIVSAEILPTTPGLVQPKAAKITGRGEASLSLSVETGSDPLAAATGVVTLTDAAGVTSAYSIRPELAPNPAGHATGLLPLLVLAFAGGLVLNLMPCVFPILAMKALALARLTGADMRRRRAEAFSYTAGVVLAFVGLGTVLIAARATGQAGGWGFQFQSPVFVTCVTWLLFAVGLNLSGVFTIGGGLMGSGQGFAGRSGHVGSFLTGLLAVVVASPCTAPFMGTAVAGAVALHDTAALGVFGALGLGLAAPYAVVALVPGLSRLLPRPGGWMRVLQQALAFPMYAAAVWLVWVLSQQAGPGGVLVAGAGLVAIGLGGWGLGLGEQRSGWPRRIARGSAAAAGALLAALLHAGNPANAAAGKSEPFTTARLEDLRAAGRPVFVDMTASWCLSCLVNEHLALAVPAVQQAFARADVTVLRGDWTSQDPAISAFLHQLGQDGVPLYVLYPPRRDPVMLPQLLSQQTVLDAITKLKG